MALMAILSTVEQGAPRSAPMWFLWEDGALWLPASRTTSSVRRLQADPVCAVEIVHHDNARGILLHLGLRGEADIVPMEASKFRRLLSKYLGPDEGEWNRWFMHQIARIHDPEGRLIRLVPQLVFTNNVSFFRTGPDSAWP
jgi:hypothetical protein